jgi:hypothetical protein
MRYVFKAKADEQIKPQQSIKLSVSCSLNTQVIIKTKLNLYGTTEFTPGFSGVRVARALVFCVAL